MRLIRGLHNLKIQTQKSIVTIGNFDGLHLAHQHIIQKMSVQAAELNLQTVVILFEPQPKEYFMQDHAPLRLMPLREKLRVLKQMGVDKILCLYFNDFLEKLSPEDFINHIIIQKLKVHTLWVGEDFRWGYRQQGDMPLLKQLAECYHFQVMPLSILKNAHEKISSTQIRNLLVQGQIEAAAALLGRPFCLSGRVMRGDGRGRGLGFPTANIHLPPDYKGPFSGVYVVKVDDLHGVANIGTRPTFNGVNTVLEVHLFNFSSDIYGRHIIVEFIHKLRDEQRFDGIEALKQQIAMDVKSAKQYFSQLSSRSLSAGSKN